jgi:adenylate cyclase
VKGFLRPVRSYKVLDLVDEAVGEKPVIRAEQDGLRVFVDLHKLDKTSAVDTLESILSRLRR